MTVPSLHELERWLEVATAIAREAGKELVSRFDESVEVEHKSNAIDLVTSADRAAEEIIVRRLRETFPEHSIAAEESGELGSRQPGTPTWMVDPLDGTTNFAHGYPHFSVLIALYCGDAGLLAVTFDPLRDEMFSAQAGGGAWLQRGNAPAQPLAVTHTDAVERSVLATGFAYDRATTQCNNIAEFSSMVLQVRGIRRAGSAGLDLAWVAAGRLDGYWEYHLNPWDWSGGALLVREAGGMVEAIGGSAWSPGDDSLIAAGPRLQRPLQDALRSA